VLSRLLDVLFPLDKIKLVDLGYVCLELCQYLLLGFGIEFLKIINAQYNPLTTLVWRGDCGWSSGVIAWRPLGKSSFN
jgi:hypothetical protein